MRLLAPAVLLPLALALGVAACAEEPEPPATFPTEAVGPSGLPPPIYLSVSSGQASAEPAAASSAPAPAPASAAPLRVDTPRASVQFFGPVSTVNIAPVAAPPPPPPGG